MPELPEVERGRCMAERILAGRRIEAVEVACDPIVYQDVPPDRVREALRGKRVLEARRWGKQLWLVLDAPPHPLFHFGMSGSFRTADDTPLKLASGPHETTDRWPPRFSKIVLRADSGAELAMTDARRLGRILLRADPEREPPLSRLGFDPLLAPPGTRALAALLTDRRAPIKSLLLDQSLCAGVGNWIADEVLYQAGIDPRRPAGSLTSEEVRRLRTKLVAIVKRGVACTTGERPYPPRWLFHRRWRKRPDAVTARGEAVEHTVVGGRTTAWVPARQH